ncbi:MAG: VWA domain-containing protein [Bacteroidia bacterium]|nr:VWA domain-containing protein [Bacteroidia bacterium]
MNRILFIFDDSYSMYAPWNSNVKIDVAKKVMSDFLDSLKNIPNLEIALRCYGHQTFFHPNRDCRDTKLEVPFAPAKTNYQKIKDVIKKLEPKGTTPIAYSLGQATNDFPACANCRNIVILITDGIEECDGNPCAVSLEMQKKGIFLRPFVIGIGLDVQFADVFGCMGKFYDVSNEANFKDVLFLVLTEALNRTTVEVDLLDINKKPTETDVNMTFFEAGTKKVIYQYVHTMNHAGRPDTIILNPDLKYDLLVHTLPPVFKQNIIIEKGKHNVISLDAPQGYLKVEMIPPLPEKFPKYIIRKSGSHQTLDVVEVQQQQKLIIGNYDLEILTLPRIIINQNEVKQSQIHVVKIPSPGTLVIRKTDRGFGSIYTDNGKKVEWVYNLNTDQTFEQIRLQPGNYKLVFRKEQDNQTLKTIEKNFEIKSGQSINLQL